MFQVGDLVTLDTDHSEYERNRHILAHLEVVAGEIYEVQDISEIDKTLRVNRYSWWKVERFKLASPPKSIEEFL